MRYFFISSPSFLLRQFQNAIFLLFINKCFSRLFIINSSPITFLWRQFTQVLCKILCPDPGSAHTIRSLINRADTVIDQKPFSTGGIWQTVIFQHLPQFIHKFLPNVVAASTTLYLLAAFSVKIKKIKMLPVSRAQL